MKREITLTEFFRRITWKQFTYFFVSIAFCLFVTVFSINLLYNYMKIPTDNIWDFVVFAFALAGMFDTIILQLVRVVTSNRFIRFFGVETKLKPVKRR